MVRHSTLLKFTAKGIRHKQPKNTWKYMAQLIILMPILDSGCLGFYSVTLWSDSQKLWGLTATILLVKIKTIAN